MRKTEESEIRRAVVRERVLLFITSFSVFGVSWEQPRVSFEKLYLYINIHFIPTSSKVFSFFFNIPVSVPSSSISTKI